jgi:hypothetical protein
MAGLGFGRQWGGALYLAATSTVGLSAFTKSHASCPGNLDECYVAEVHHYTAAGPYWKPELALGLVLPPGLSVEVGPYAVLAPPLAQWADLPPVGSWVGHAGLELSVLTGSGGPRSPWRR